MSISPRTVLGIDAGTQSLSAVLLRNSTGEILWSRSRAYRDDPRLPGFGFEHDTMVIPPRAGHRFHLSLADQRAGVTYFGIQGKWL